MNQQFPILGAARLLLYGLALVVLVGGICAGVSLMAEAGAAGLGAVVIGAVTLAILLVLFGEVIGLLVIVERNTRTMGDASDEIIKLLRSLNTSHQELLTLQKRLYGQGGGEHKAPPPATLAADFPTEAPPRTPPIQEDAAGVTRRSAAVTKPGPAPTTRQNATPQALPSTTDLHAMIPNLSAEQAVQMGEMALQAGRYTDAAELFSRALTLQPPFVEAYPLRASAYQQLGETERAEADMATYRQLTGGR